MMGEARAGRGHGVRAWLKKHKKVKKRIKRPGEEHSNGYNVPSEDRKRHLLQRKTAPDAVNPAT